ncbi:MAG: TIR domain-containing protein [Clostridia bacterium]|nr:TIR domain-containing protein [Clostridia bacterium]
MGHKVFVSYKYSDSDVKHKGKDPDKTTTARDYVDELEARIKALDGYVYKGEENDEDLSEYADETIEKKLKDKMYDCTVTVLLISPNMKVPKKWERSQWIPWEISYSIKEETRNDRTSHSNAIVGVVLPDKNGSYEYQKTMSQFKIVRNNILNGYIEPVDWNKFIGNINGYIELAIKKKATFPEYKLDKGVD